MPLGSTCGGGLPGPAGSARGGRLPESTCRGGLPGPAGSARGGRLPGSTCGGGLPGPAGSARGGGLPGSTCGEGLPGPAGSARGIGLDSSWRVSWGGDESSPSSINVVFDSRNCRKILTIIIRVKNKERNLPLSSLPCAIILTLKAKEQPSAENCSHRSFYTSLCADLCTCPYFWAKCARAHL